MRNIGPCGLHAIWGFSGLSVLFLRIGQWFAQHSRTPVLFGSLITLCQFGVACRARDVETKHQATALEGRRTEDG